MPGSHQRSEEDAGTSVTRATMEDFRAALAKVPTICSVKDDDALGQALDSRCPILFIRYGSLLDLDEIVGRVKAAGKLVYVDVDLLEGFAGLPVVVAHLALNTGADGILSAKIAVVRSAKQHGMVAGHRFKLIDTRAYRSVEPQSLASGADFIEVLPGCIPRVIACLHQEIAAPIIGGGLVFDRQDVRADLDAGAIGVATSNRGLWEP